MFRFLGFVGLYTGLRRHQRQFGNLALRSFFGGVDSHSMNSHVHGIISSYIANFSLPSQSLSFCYCKRRFCSIRNKSPLLVLNHYFHLSIYISRQFSMMAAQESPPYIPQNPQEVATLVRNLESGLKKGKSQYRQKQRDFSCKKATFRILGSDDVDVDSWRFQDWDYKRDDLPTYARGLFTYKRKDGTPEIAIRGYDKFFNVEEVNDTKWRNVEARTKGPYELSVKENGCIIFISGLENDVLLVCSKHSTGPRGDVNISHAVTGEKWIDKHLATVGKTRRELAGELRSKNITAVAELCDDSFEEHVLAYDEKSSGLYLHGINLNLPEFATYPGYLVHKFADEWGLLKAEYLIKEDIETVKTFLDGCAETGSWNGRDTEGFVIRCQKQEAGSYVNWFFKYKFEEPYLMYRQWREATKAIISGKAPKYKKHKQITDEYLLYARKQLAKTPGLGKAYNANHGIIALRDGFLNGRGLKGSDIIRQEHAASGTDLHNVINNLILVPLATIGCGKTTVAVALAKLFDWGHIQNDNITGQKGRPRQFAVQVTNSLAEHPVVIADRNNHQKRERKQLFDDIGPVVQGVRFVALHYVHNQNLSEVRKVTQQRVLERGDNHQTIQAGTKSREEIISIMEGFLHRFQPLDSTSEPDDAFDEVIDLDISASSRDNLETVVKALHEAYPKLVPDLPSPSDLDGAIAAALNEYEPLLKHDLSFQSKNKNIGPKNSRDNQSNSSVQSKEPKIEYFCLKVPTTQVLTSLKSTFQSQNPTASKFYLQLQQTHRIQAAFHVTLMHRASIPQHGDLWNHLTSLHSTASGKQQGTKDPLLGKCRVQLERVVWDKRVMCIVARISDQGWETVNAVTHITIGTADSNIKPKESNMLLEKWLQNGANEETGIGELLLKGENEVLAEARAVFGFR